MDKKIKLFPRINKANNQISFQLKKSCLPEDIKNKLPKLKNIKVGLGDFEFR